MDERTRRNRDKAILDAYSAAAREMTCAGRPLETRKLIKLVVEQDAPRFYVDYDSARRVISMMERGVEIRTRNTNKRRMYRDMHKLFLEQRAHSKEPGYLALMAVLSGPAPSFYLAASTVRTIVYRGIKKGL